MSPSYRKDAQNKIIDLMEKIYQRLEEIQQQSGKKILVFEEDFVTYESGKDYKGFGFKREPFLFGDTFGFTIYRDSLDKEEIYYIYEYYKNILEIDFEIHIADGFYETNDYSLGNKLYFRGYCMDLLSTLHKKETQKELNKLKRKIKL